MAKRKGTSTKQKTKIRVQIAELRTDPHQYKPFAPTFTPAKPLYWDVEVTAGKVREVDGAIVVDDAALINLMEQIFRRMLFLQPTRTG